MKEIKITPSITPPESENLNRYFQDIRSSVPLTPDEEADLAVRIQHGDLEARNQLVTANLRFVISVAKQYQNLGLPLDDIINEGNIGLIRAAELFDPTRGFKFDSFAVWWIRQAIISFIVERSRTVRLPQNVSSAILRIRSASGAFEQENHRAPSADELAEEVDIPVERIENYLNYAATTTSSLDAPLSIDSDTTIGDSLPDTSVAPTDHSLMSESLRHDLEVAMRVLDSREQSVLRLFYGFDGEALSMESIAMELHLTRERVRQLIERSIESIRRTHGAALQKYV